MRFVADLTPLRESRELRLLVLGSIVSGLGTQAALVALPYQIYLETRSTFLTGLLGAARQGSQGGRQAGAFPDRGRRLAVIGARRGVQRHEKAH